MPSLFALALATTASLTLTDAVRTQARLVVPASATDAEQPSSHAAPGIGFDGRIQFIIDEAALLAARGRNLLALEFRRDTSRTTDLPAGSALASVRIGRSLVPAHAAIADFASNAPNTNLVFAGSLQVATSSVSGYVGWVAPHTLRIDFQTPFAYADGPLAIEIDASSVQPSWWPLDTAHDAARGTVTKLGSSCSPFALSGAHGSESVEADPAELVAGSTATFTQSTAPFAGAIGLLAFSPLAVPWNLNVIGAPGCALHVMPIASIPPTMSHHSTVHGSTHAFTIALPADPALLSARLVWQSVELGSQGLATTEALDCTLAASLPSLGIAMLEARAGGIPVLRHHHVPVVGLLHD
ncbi:MAG: hypothetical protein AB7I19_18970 [Planctomycetota bacterium]